jgi:hypothetical protein
MSFRAFVQAILMERSGLSRTTTLSSKRIVCHATSIVFRAEQLLEAKDNWPFEAACAYEAQEPAEESREPILEPSHESNVHDEPDEPRDSTRKPDAVRAEDSAATVHGGHAPKVPVLPGSGLGTASDTVSDDASGMETGLNGHLGNAWQIVPIHHVADYEHFRVAGQ